MLFIVRTGVRVPSVEEDRRPQTESAPKTFGKLPGKGEASTLIAKFLRKKAAGIGLVLEIQKVTG